MWSELAWQLGGREGYRRIAADDEKATSPGDAIRGLLNDFGPCVVLIDEWVAYARQLHHRSDLPAGSFETQFTFAQTLTESAKAAFKCLLVISLPASDTAESPHAQADDVEVGGVRGREALNRLDNVIGRLESAWHAATPEEGFAIVCPRPGRARLGSAISLNREEAGTESCGRRPDRPKSGAAYRGSFLPQFPTSREELLRRE